MEELRQAITGFYHIPGLKRELRKAFRHQGLDPDKLTLSDTGAIDEFHTAGRHITVQAIEHLKIRPKMRVLDAGCGLGGTARLLAERYDCRVEGVDLTRSVVDIAKSLTRSMGLGRRCRFRNCCVTATGFPDNHFDAALSLEAAMNIPDRDCFYPEMTRVLKPNARFCTFDVVAGPQKGAQFPTPWADTAKTSFLFSEQDTLNLMKEAGFEIEKRLPMRNLTNFVRHEISNYVEHPKRPGVGLHMLMGEDMILKLQNFADGLDKGHFDLVMILARKK